MSGELLDFIADTIGDVLPSVGLTLDATLIKTTEGAYTSGAVSGDTAKTTTSYAAQGIVASYADGDIDGTLITRSDRLVKLVGRSIASGQVPAQGDKIAIDGTTYTVIGVGRDAAKAMYLCQCRA